MTMLASCRASSRTIAWPIPLLPPVTMATLFFRDITNPSIPDAESLWTLRHGAGDCPFAGRCGVRRQRPTAHVLDQQVLASTQKGARKFELPPNKPLSDSPRRYFTR